MDFTVTITKKELLDKWSKVCSTQEWIDMYKMQSDSYSSWSTDLELADFIVKRVKEGFIDKYRDDDIPEVLKPLLLNAISQNIENKNDKNRNLTLEDVGGENELEAIKRLRNYKSIDYDDAINLFCDGYDFAKDSMETNVDLTEISTKDLFRELESRT